MIRAPENAIRLSIAEHLWGWTPHPSQRKWLETQAQTKVAACGRRWGKTESAAIDAITTAIVRPASVQMIVSPTYDQSRLIFDTVERLALGSPVTRPLTRVTRTPYPRLTIGRSLIMARTADEDGRNLRGHAADRVIVDEAAYVRDSVIQEVIAPMLADRDGELVMISTPFGKNHFYRAFVRGQASSCTEQATEPAKSGQRRAESPSTGKNGHMGSLRTPRSAPRPAEGPEPIVNRKSKIENRDGVVSFSFPSWENPHISSDYIERQRAELSPRQFAVEYEAAFLDDQAAVFSWEEIEAAAGRYSALCTPHSELVVAGIDWARYSDYTALVAVRVTEQGLIVVGIDRFNGIGWSRQIERAVEFLRTHRVSAALTDQTSIGDPLLEQLRTKAWEAGIETTIEGFAFTNASKRELVEHLSMRFAHGEIAIPRDERLVKELQYFEYELTGSGSVRLNARPGHHDDLVIALALACRQGRAYAASPVLLSRNGRGRAECW